MTSMHFDNHNIINAVCAIEKVSCYFVHTEIQSNPDFRESREAKRPKSKQIIYHFKVQKTRKVFITGNNITFEMNVGLYLFKM